MLLQTSVLSKQSKFQDILAKYPNVLTPTSRFERQLVNIQHAIVTNGKIVKTRFHYQLAKEHSLFLLLVFPRLKLKRALSKAKKSIKQTKNNFFHARSGNGPLKVS